MKNHSGEAKPFQVLKSEKIPSRFSYGDKHSLVRNQKGNVRNDSKYGPISEVDIACHCGCRDGLRASPERKPDSFVICHLVKSSNWMDEAARFRMDK